MSQNTWGNVGVVVLAAGQGKRLNSVDTPKVMVKIGEKPMIGYTVETLEKMGFLPEQICAVVGFQKEKIMDYLGQRVKYVVQEELLGTAHAAYTGTKALSASIKHVLVIGGDDSAFYTAETLRNLVDTHLDHENIVTLLGVKLARPPLVGRVVRHDDGRVEVIEKEYLTDEQRKICEVSTGTFVFDRAWFEEIFPTMPKLRKLGEYGLPTTLALAQATQKKLEVLSLKNPDEWLGVNTLEELAEARKRKLFKV